MNDGRDLIDDEAEVTLPDHPVSTPVAQLVSLDDIHELENVRTTLGDVSAFAENIRVRGLLHPVVLRPAQDTTHGKPFEIIVGYRRLAAFRSLRAQALSEDPQHTGWDMIPAVVHAATDEELLAEMVSENLQRENHSAIDEARTMQRMIDTFGWSHRQVAAALGVDRTQVTKRLSLLKLPEKVQTLVGDGQLTASHAEVIARLDRPESQEELADLAVRKDTPVAKLNSYASKLKERDDERIDAEADSEAQVIDESTPLEVMTTADVVELPRMIVRDDLAVADLARVNLYVLLRSANDEEMLDVLAHRFQVSWRDLWDWVAALDDDQVRQMNETMLRRWLGAAHRFPTLPEALVGRFSAGSGSNLDPADAPDVPDVQIDEWDDGDWDDDDWDDE